MYWHHLETLPRTYPGIAKILPFVVYHMGTRSFEQFCGTLRSTIDPYHYCPFCFKERERRRQKSLDCDDGWMLLPNEYPHKGVERMWLLVPQRHIKGMEELEFRDWRAVSELMRRFLHLTGLRGGGVMWRFGDPHLHAGTVEHLHINIVEPKCGTEYRPPFAKNENEHASDYARMLGFRDELARRGGESWLMSPEGIGATQPKVTT